MKPRKFGAADENEPELVLSPSESFAHNTAMKVAGTTGPKTQRALASIVLGFELFVVFLVGMTVYGLSILDPRELGIYGGLGLCAVILVGLGMMRVGRVGIIIGWITQVLLLLSGFILPSALIVGAIFTALWVYCMVKGAKIDRDREAWLLTQQ